MSDIWHIHTLSAGDLNLHILPGIGGRLWDIAFQGRSLLFQNSDLDGYIPDLGDMRGFPTRSPQFGFPLWGGEKTWIAPDSNWPDGAPFAALDSGPYEITDSSPAHIALQSTICPQSKLQIEREIRVIAGNSFSIRHKVTNRGTRNQDVGIWSVMMINHKARIGVAGHQLNAAPVFGDPKGCVSSTKDGVICVCSDPSEYKVSIENPSACTFLCIDHNPVTVWMRCQTKRPDQGSRFAHAHPLEVFNSGDYPYCEAEWHAPLCTLPQNVATEFAQNFTVWTDTAAQKLEQPELELLTCMS